MSTTTLTPPVRVNTAGAHARPGLGRLVAVELRKMVNTRPASGCRSPPSRSPRSS